MAYTPTNWTTGDTITATKLNKMEQGIADGGGGSWDAVIRLVHANNSGRDIPVNLTPSIVEGSYTDLMDKLSDGGCPCILVEYTHLMFPTIRFSAPMGYVSYIGDAAISITIAGYSGAEGILAVFGTIAWYGDDTLAWN